MPVSTFAESTWQNFMRETQEARQDSALVALLEALPPERLARVLRYLGIEPETAEKTSQKRDDRRCLVCSHGYVRCREIDSKSPDDHHDWSPNHNRAGVPAQAPGAA